MIDYSGRHEMVWCRVGKTRGGFFISKHRIHSKDAKESRGFDSKGFGDVHEM